MLGVAAAFTEYLGAADFLGEVSTVFLDGRLSSHKVL
jgi:hypothetical protein